MKSKSTRFAAVFRVTTKNSRNTEEIAGAAFAWLVFYSDMTSSGVNLGDDAPVGVFRWSTECIDIIFYKRRYRGLLYQFFC